MAETLTGRCLCGAVRYRLGPRLGAPTFCHCESCRRASGAHAVAWLTVRVADLRYTAGKPREIESSPGVVRAFCPRCGAALSYRAAHRPGEVDVTVGTLDEPGRAAPVDHIWMADAPPWDRPADGLPQYPGSRPRA
jgi:hypothetical protein